MKLLKDTCVLVKAETIGETTASGIVLSGEERGKKQERGEVMQVGAEVSKVKVGDKVIFKMYHTHTIEAGDEELELVEESDLLATYED
jgi:co-chaperonin GroES (HSP10)